MLPSASILPSHNPLQAPSFIRTSNASFMRRIRRNYDSWDHRLEYSMNENGRSSGWLETGRCVCSEKIQCLVKSSEIWWNRSVHPLYVYFLRPKFVKSNMHMTTFYFISNEIVQLVAIPMQMKQQCATVQVANYIRSIWPEIECCWRFDFFESPNSHVAMCILPEGLIWLVSTTQGKSHATYSKQSMRTIFTQQSIRRTLTFTKRTDDDWMPAIHGKFSPYDFSSYYVFHLKVKHRKRYTYKFLFNMKFSKSQ